MNAVRRARGQEGQSGKAVVLILVLLIGLLVGVAAWLLLQRRPTGLAATASRMAPESAQAFLAMDLTRIGLSEAKRKKAFAAFRESEVFGKLKEALQRDLGLSLDEDVFPWMEPAGVLALAPPEGKTSLFSRPWSASSGGSPPFRGFAAASVNDEAKAAQALAKLEGKGAIPYKTEAYEGATLHLPEQADKGPSWTVHRKFLIVGVTPGDVKSALDGLAGKGRSLADSPRYRQAVGKLRRTEALVAYADLQGMLSAVNLQEIRVPEARQFVGAMRAAVAGAGGEGGDIISEFFVEVDPKAGGPIAAEVFKPAYGLDMKTVELHPAETEVYVALNAKMLWQMAYDILGHFPEGKMFRDMPGVQLQQKGVSLQSDILDALTGELSYALANYGELAAASLEPGGGAGAPGPPMEALQNLRAVLALTLARREKIEGLLDRFLPAEMKQGLQTVDHQGTKIHSVPGQFAYALLDDYLIVGINEPEAEIKKMIDARKSGRTLRTRPGFDRLSGLVGGARPILLSYGDPRKAYGGMAERLQPKDPALARLLRLLGDADAVWQIWVLRPDGLYGASLTTGMK